MPVYIYGDNQGHQVQIAHGMTEVVGVWCPDCGHRMSRIPQRVHAHFPNADPAYRQHQEIHSHLRARYYQNRERREANEHAYQKSKEAADRN
jgi:hypothetical protein